MQTNTVFSVNSNNLSESGNFLDALVRRAKSGEDAALTEIYNLYFQKMYRFIFYRVGHHEMAEDLAEDVFIKAFSKLSSLSQEQSFEGWLYQIARNLVVDYYRQKRATVALQDVENTLEYESNLIEVVSLKEQQAVMLKLLRELTADQQLVIKLKFLEELDNPEIAQIMGKQEGAVRVIQHRAIQRLQELINKRNAPEA